MLFSIVKVQHLVCPAGRLLLYLPLRRPAPLGIVIAVAIGIAEATQLRCASGGDSAGHGNRFSSVGSENLETSAGALGVYLYP